MIKNFDHYQHKKEVLKKIVLKLWARLLKEFKIDNTIDLFFNFTINHDFLTSYFQTNYNFIDNTIQHQEVVINLASVLFLLKEGYNNSYYNGRKDRLSFLKNNFKLTLLFCILHELRHIIQARELKTFKNFNLYKKNYITEIEADNFALNYLKRKNYLKKDD